MYVQWDQNAHADQTIAQYYLGCKNHDYVWKFPDQLDGHLCDDSNQWEWSWTYVLYCSTPVNANQKRIRKTSANIQLNSKLLMVHNDQ